ncbi:MAG: hypothetical protein FWB72_05190 [Firmicutes bacterium]|nr:hypothetical protein [Bacillota bacterium]
MRRPPRARGTYGIYREIYFCLAIPRSNRKGGARKGSKKVCKQSKTAKGKQGLAEPQADNNPFNWLQIVKTGALAGLKPNEIYALELWEYNAFIEAYHDKQKQNISNAILTGYYAAYYINGGKKTKPPNKLIDEMYKPTKQKQSFEDGLKDIQKIMELEKQGETKWET